MDSKTTGIVAYLTWIGFIVSIIIGAKDDEFAKHHQNQALILNIASLVGFIPFIGWILGLPILILAIMGFISAINNEEKPLPVIGGIKLIK